MLLVVFARRTELDQTLAWLSGIGELGRFPLPEIATVVRSCAGHVTVHVSGTTSESELQLLVEKGETTAIVIPPGLDVTDGAVALFGAQIRSAATKALHAVSFTDAGEALDVDTAAVIVRIDGLNLVPQPLDTLEM